MDSPTKSDTPVTPANRITPGRFLSLRWKTLFASMLFLLLINSVFSGLLYLKLTDQFESDRMSEYLKSARHLKGLLDQSFHGLLQAGEMIPMLDGLEQALLSGDPNAVPTVFSRQWGDLQLHLNIDEARFYSAAGQDQMKYSFLSLVFTRERILVFCD